MEKKRKGQDYTVRRGDQWAGQGKEENTTVIA
jgi:hypothetical protein